MELKAGLPILEGCKTSIGGLQLLTKDEVLYVEVVKVLRQLDDLAIIYEVFGQDVLETD